MKKFFLTALIFIFGACLPNRQALVFAEIPVPFFGGNNFTIDVDTIFGADLNDGSTGLQTIIGIGLWFEFTPYQDRNITPQRDRLSVSLKMSNSAFYAWRGYDDPDDSGYLRPTLWGQQDQATSVWFDTIIAQLEYNQYWLRIAGIEPEITLSQGSIRSVFDPAITVRTDVDKNRLPLPLFQAGSLYGSPGGVVSVIGQDLVHLNRREVEISGNFSAGMNTELFDLTLKAGSWKTGAMNDNNAWVGGLDFTFRPDFSNTINFSFLGAVNYDTVTRRKGNESNEPVDDPMADPEKLKENPIAFGLGYDYRINIPNSRMVLRPYIGADYIYEIESRDYNFEVGGGLQFFFRGTGTQFKRDNRIGGISIGAVDLPAALFVGFNVDRNKIVNGIVSLNEDPRASLIPGLGGFLNLELMNIGGQEYNSYAGNPATPAVYNDFLWAMMAQVEYIAHEKLMPYVFVRYLPALQDLYPGYKTDPDPVPTYGKDYLTLTTKAGLVFTPYKFFAIDLWYERNDVSVNNDWTMDKGLISVNFRISMN